MVELSYLSQDEAQWIREYRHDKYLMDEYLNRKYALEEGREEGREEGIAEGREEEKLASAVLMITKYHLPLAEVCKDLGLEEETVREAMSKAEPKA